jgi:hypothetical protein
MLPRPLFAPLVIGALALCATTLSAQAIRAGFNTSSLGPTDDGFVSIANIGFAFNFYGAGPLFINNNGNVTFGDAYESFTPGPLASTGARMLAPFFADVDTRASTAVRYGTGVVGARNAFGVNWLDVGYFNSELVPPGLIRRNNFQLIFIDRNDLGLGNFDVEFNYGAMQWETGDASGGVNGLGGDDCARAGWSNGTGGAFELAGSGTCGALIGGGSNSVEEGSSFSQPGRYGFEVRNGAVVTPGTTVPEPSTYALMAVGLTAIGVLSRRRAATSLPTPHGQS